VAGKTAIEVLVELSRPVRIEPLEFPFPGALLGRRVIGTAGFADKVHLSLSSCEVMKAGAGHLGYAVIPAPPGMDELPVSNLPVALPGS
jgi:hypothetical protein